MLLPDIISSFYDAIDLFESYDALSDTLSSICQEAGFSYFAVTHHGHFNGLQPDLIRLHNYPQHFVQYHDRNGLGVRDPVHRMSQLRGAGFPWSALPSLLPDYGPADEQVLACARKAGVVDGYTIPFHVPGERSGSCSFAVGPGREFPRHLIPLAQSLGVFAFEAARLLCSPGTRTRFKSARLTERQHQIVVLLGHGKPLKEIARILDISRETVNDHLRHARARFGVHKSTLLLVCGLLSGSITYSELLGT